MSIFLSMHPLPYFIKAKGRGLLRFLQLWDSGMSTNAGKCTLLLSCEIKTFAL
jgi:hypothetical protein